MIQPYSFRDGAGRFRFIGRDGSLGYRTGKVYSLAVYPIFNGPYTVTEKLAIERLGFQRLLHGAGYCPYDNQGLFFENWEQA